MNTGISFQTGPKQEDRCREGREDQARPAGPQVEGRPACGNLEKGVQGLLSLTEPVSTPTLLYAKFPSVLHCERVGVDGRLVSPA